MAALYILYKLLLTVGSCSFHRVVLFKRASIELVTIKQQLHAEADEMHDNADAMHVEADNMHVAAAKMHADVDALGPAHVDDVDSLRARLALF